MHANTSDDWTPAEAKAFNDLHYILLAKLNQYPGPRWEIIEQAIDTIFGKVYGDCSSDEEAERYLRRAVEDAINEIKTRPKSKRGDPPFTLL